MGKRSTAIKFSVFFLLILVLILLDPTEITSSKDKNKLGTASAIKIAFNFIADKHEPLKGEGKDRINVLLLGIPGVGNPAPFLTDTIFLLSVKPSTQQLGLVSLPRDLLVQIPGQNTKAKINALYRLNGNDPELIVKKAEEITGQEAHYYTTLDISGIEKIVDALGGLNVFVPEDIYDPTFPTSDFGTEVFEVQKGWRYFDGETVQKYLRTRHSEDGDYARMRQQQAVIEALRKKVFGLNLLYDFPTVFSLYSTLTDHIRTDIDESGIKRFYDIARDISYDKVTYTVVDGNPKNKDALLESKTIQLGGGPAFVLVPKTGEFDYYSIRELTENIF